MATRSASVNVSPKLKVLEASLDAIRLACSQSQSVSAISSDGASVEVCPWVQQALERFSHASDESPTDAVVAQGVALMLRSEKDLLRSRSPEDEVENYAVQGELMLDAAVGSSLVREIQIEIDRLLAEGNAAESRQLSKFHHELRGVVHELRRSIGESERSRAASLAAEWAPEETAETDSSSVEQQAPAQTSPPRSTASSPQDRQTATSDPAKPGPPKPNPARAREFSVRQTQPNGTGANKVATYAALALIAVAAWGFWSHRQSTQQIQSTSLQADAKQVLQSLAHVTRVQARKPFAVITVDDAFWVDAGPTTRQSWLGDVARQSKASGFEGVVVRSAAGTPLAEWLKGQSFEIKRHPASTRGS